MSSDSAIAVIGLGCRYPGAPGIRELWENILARRQQFRRMPDVRLPLADYYSPDRSEPDKTYGSHAAVIDGFSFDWKAHFIPKLVYETSDIAHWLALEVALQALTDSGYTRDTVPNDRAGVILGNTLTGDQTRATAMRHRWPFVLKSLRAAAHARGLDHILPELEQPMEEYYKSVFAPTTEDSLSGGLSNTIAGRICNYLNFHGGGYTVDGACASSLLAVVTAANALVNHDMDFVLAGGVDVSLDTFELIGFAKTGALTPDDMRVYDRRANGFIPGEGCGFVVLKRLKDARADGNYVYAILHGWGISSDGKGGLTSPSYEAQAEALQRAYQRAGYGPQTVAFFEGHGTGTSVGDRAELEGIMLALGEPESRSEFRRHGITSLKSIVGHTKAAAGIGGFIKSVIAVNRRVIPPTAGCTEPNAVFDKPDCTLYPILNGIVCNPRINLRAGVSAMGFGGINSHVTIESGDAPSALLEPSMDERLLLASRQDTELFVLSATSVGALMARVQSVVDVASGISIAEMIDLAAQLADELEPFSIRAAVIADTPGALLKELELLLEMLRHGPPSLGQNTANQQQTIWVGNDVHRDRVGFLFPGQGSQQLNMARTLVERFPWAQELVADTDTWVSELGLEPISSFIFAPMERMHDREHVKRCREALGRTEVAQPAICLASVIWLTYLLRLGVKPIVVGGHSLGELIAFHAASAFDVQALIRLAAMRGQQMAASAESAGTMVSLTCPAEVANNLLQRVDGYAVVANINGPHQTVISGEPGTVRVIAECAEAEGIRTRMLAVSNAFHSDYVSKAAEYLRANAPVPNTPFDLTIPLISGIDGEKIESVGNLPQYLAEQVTRQVNFAAVAKTLAQQCDLIVEVGPGRVLSDLVKDITRQDLCLPVSSKPERDRDLNVLLARLFTQGGTIHWSLLYEARLVRPFVPTSKRLFIENPCERPYNVNEGAATPHMESQGVAKALLSRGTSIPFPILTAYLSQRGKFIEEIIKLDMQHSPVPYLPGSSATESEIPSPETTDTPREVYPNTVAAIEGRLIELIAQRTGYPVDSFSRASRLLDDLNLDSIKAGELIASLAREFGVGGKLEPSALANASVEAIAAAVQYSMIQADTHETPLELLRALVQERVGLPREALSAQSHLLEDMHLDLKTANALIGEAAQRLGITGPIEPSLSHATLSEIAEVLQQAAQENVESVRAASGSNVQTSSWVRNFITEYVPVPLSETVLDDWSEATVLVLYERDESDVAGALCDAFGNRLARVWSVTFGEVDQLTLPASVTHMIGVLPRTSKPAPSTDAYVYRVVERLHTVASLSAAEFIQLAFIQFGGGQFGTHASIPLLDSCCTIAFAESIHLERPTAKVRVIDFDPSIEPAVLVERVLAELSTAEQCVVTGYDSQLTRCVPVRRIKEAAEYQPRMITWSAEDVILVTGGAKGITAECALALAQSTGVQMALVGSSPPPGPSDTNSEIARTLERFSAAGLVARYYQCNITDPGAVHALVEQVQQGLGPISGVIHGAANNKPQRVEHVSVERAYAEIAPKVMGALALCDALRDSPPKLFVAMTSIIGVTGMPGNAWYAFSNEALDLILRRFQQECPSAASLSIAFSLWADVGMGMRFRSVDRLAKMHVGAIPTETGIRRFLQLLECDPSEHQIIVSARLGSLDTWRPAMRPAIPIASRYLEKVIYLEPSVELIVHAQLTLERDTYLKDHVFRGSYLFPAVFGLEAMAQVVAYVTGVSQFASIRISNLRLERPIVVDPDKGVIIEIRAEVLERETIATARYVQVGIRTEQTGFLKDHFLATFVLGAQDDIPTEVIEIPAHPLDLEPGADLYGWLLFQGPQFQRLKQIHALDSARCLFSAQIRSYSDSAGLSDGEAGPFILGDPYFRDSLLQAAQLTISQDICLPIYIESIELYDIKNSATRLRNGAAFFDGIQDRHAFTHVFALEADGRLAECMNGLQLQIMEHRNDYPTPEQVADPTQRDSALIYQKLGDCSVAMNVLLPKLVLEPARGWHDLPRERRHQRELPLLLKTVSQVLSTGDAAPVQILWRGDDRPFVENSAIGVALSHDDQVCLCVASEGTQGCDITPMLTHAVQEWESLLGFRRSPLMTQLLKDGDSLNYAGTRIWTAIEALRKATSVVEIELTVKCHFGDSVLFEGQAAGTKLFVLTVPIQLTLGPQRMIAVVVQMREPVASTYPAAATTFDTTAFAMHVSHDGPQGQTVLALRFPVTFRETANRSRTLYFSHYFNWMGKLREVGCQPINSALIDQLTTGKWGLVTNRAETRITGAASATDVIEGRVWLDNVYSPTLSTMALGFEWCKLLGDGARDQIATSRMTTTWVALRDDGIAEAHPFPPYFKEYIDSIAPPHWSPSESDVPYVSPLLGGEQWRGQTGPDAKVLLSEAIFDTSLEESNLVGNIYFANYPTWQGCVVDRFLYRIAPEHFCSAKTAGELRCVYSKTEYLREALPFEQIAVRMYLGSIYEHGIQLHFDYFRLTGDGHHEKLAFGEYQAAWMTQLGNHVWKPFVLPEVLRDALSAICINGRRAYA